MGGAQVGKDVWVELKEPSREIYKYTGRWGKVMYTDRFGVDQFRDR